jgi:hypothetical protein
MKNLVDKETWRAERILIKINQLCFCMQCYSKMFIYKQNYFIQTVKIKILLSLQWQHFAYLIINH